MYIGDGGNDKLRYVGVCGEGGRLRGDIESLGCGVSCCRWEWPYMAAGGVVKPDCWGAGRAQLMACEDVVAGVSGGKGLSKVVVGVLGGAVVVRDIGTQ